MRILLRGFAAFITAAIFVSGISFVQVRAEEVESSDPSASSELTEPTASSEPLTTQDMLRTEEDAVLEAGSDESSEMSNEDNLRSGYFCQTQDGSIIRADEMTLADREYINYKIRSMDDLVSALGASNVSVISATEVRLLNDIYVPNNVDAAYSFLENTYIVDFNGHTVSGIIAFLIREGSNVTLKDSTGSNSGGLVTFPTQDENGNSQYCGFPIDMSGGSLMIKSGKYQGYSSAIFAREGDLRIEGGVFKTGSGDGRWANNVIDIYSDMTEVEITGGKFIGYSYAVHCAREFFARPETSVHTPLRISGGTFSSEIQDTNRGAIYYYDDAALGIPAMSELLADDCLIMPTEIYTYYDEDSDFASTYSGCNVRVGTHTLILEFIDRLYTKVLGREPDPAGKANWLSQLINGEITGSDAAFGFFFSPELTNRKLTNEKFVTLLYNVFFDRAPDKGGMNNWLSALATGASRKYVFSGFANSKEWKNLCETYGIEPGSYTSDEPRDQNLKVTAFVQRLYSLCLNRGADVEGLNNWTRALNEKNQDGAHVAYGFFFSNEFVNRKLLNADYVEVLYKVLLGRGSDPAGKADWVRQLDGGTQRMDVFRGFVHSQEFDQICADYGIVRGTI